MTEMLVFYSLVAVLGFGSVIYVSILETREKLAAETTKQAELKLRLAVLEAEQRKEAQA